MTPTSMVFKLQQSFCHLGANDTNPYYYYFMAELMIYIMLNFVMMHYFGIQLWVNVSFRKLNED